jgi:hypothetical protein
VLSRLYGHHVDVVHIHDRILVIAGHGTGDDWAPAVDPTIVDPPVVDPTARVD